MARTIPALFANHTEAARAVQDLVSQGFARDDIRVMAHNGAKHNGHSGLARGAGIGVAAGGISGLVLGASALLAVPAIGLALSVPALMATLLGAGVGAATGGLLGGLTKLGLPQEQARYYSEGLRRGSVLVTVETPETRAEEARTVLSRHHPLDLATRAEELHQSGWTREAPIPPIEMAHDTHIYGEVTSKTDLKKIFLEIRHNVEEVKSRPTLTKLYKQAGSLITLTHTPAWKEKFGKEVEALRQVAQEEFATTARKINHRATQIGTEADYDETWGDGA
jgi:hypothetical protein